MTDHIIHGDLGNLDQIPFDENYKACQYTNQKRPNHQVIKRAYEITDTNSVLVIGDSFSHMQEYYGEANYVNILAGMLPGKTIYNLDPSENYNVKVVIDLLQYQKKLPKTIVLEVAERVIPANFSSIPLKQLDKPATKVMDKRPKQVESNMQNVGNSYFQMAWLEAAVKKITKAQMFFKKSLKIKNAVMKGQLKRDFFTCKGDEDMLYFYKDDTMNRDKSVMDVCKTNMSVLYCYAKEHNVNLIIAVPSDKYAAYRPWLVKDECPEAISFLDCCKNYNPSYFINSRPFLRQELAKGTQDVYICNDSHWGTVAATLFAKTIKEKIE